MVKLYYPLLTCKKAFFMPRIASSAAPSRARSDAKVGSDVSIYGKLAELDMRERIKAVAIDLLIERGYRGASFGDIAAQLDITRANIHYHFGDKKSLITEVIEDYVRLTSNRFCSMWTDPDLSFVDKIHRSIALNRSRYQHFNSARDSGHTWSLITRMRGDSDSLDAHSIATLHEFVTDLSQAVTGGVRRAMEVGELLPTTPVEDVVTQVVAVINSTGTITQDARNFEGLEHLYLALARTVTAAYGSAQRRPSPSAKGTTPRRK